MKLVIDLQAAQSASRHRGIGRYSLALAEAMIRQARDHDVWIALNRAFDETVEPLYATFEKLLPRDRIVTWEAPTPVADIDASNHWRRRSGEILREAFLTKFKPDVVHVSSLFEGVIDNALTSVGAFPVKHRTAVTLYDLIPLIRRDTYLANPDIEAFYQRKLTSLRRADLWLAISESSRREGIEFLNLPSDTVINISAAADDRFRPVTLSDEERRRVCARYGITRSFVMYTGATDPRKNLIGLLDAYALLPQELRNVYQLLIVCPEPEAQISVLRQHASIAGLGEDEVVFAPFVPDDDLVALYNLCTSFCFPSLHEGFGLPALEAMQCGAATIGANASSVPEVIGRADALFDPQDKLSMAARLHQVLTDVDYRKNLSEYGLKQARNFSWTESARRAWGAFEEKYTRTVRSDNSSRVFFPSKLPSLAYLSPLPPERSGIADYSAELLPELSRHYQIDVIVDQDEVTDSWIRSNCAVRSVDWFRQNSASYDRVLYQFGNSPFHRHMFDLLELCPGVVVLHDFFLSGVSAHLELVCGWTGFWTRSLYYSHGYNALRERAHAVDVPEIIYKFPANLPVLENAQGIIVHSEHSKQLAQRFYGVGFPNDWTVIPHMRQLGQNGLRNASRRKLEIADTDFLVCSFGIVAPTKLNHRLLRAWLQSKLANDPNCRLVFVGEAGGDYGDELCRVIEESGIESQVSITGFAPSDLFREYLQSADLAVQLRSLSRGETSGTVLDCMAHGLPTIVNAHGSMAELPDNAVLMLPDNFTDDQLTSALEALHDDHVRREQLANRARSFVSDHLSPRFVADRYHESIESIYAAGSMSLKTQALRELAALELPQSNELEWLAVARSLERNMPGGASIRQLLVDVSANIMTELKTGIERVVRAQVLELLNSPPPGFRVEPVYLVNVDGEWRYRYARSYTSKLLGFDAVALDDTIVEVTAGDIFYSPDYHPHAVTQAATSGLYSSWRARGVEINFLVYDLLPTLRPEFFPDFSFEPHTRWIEAVSNNADRILCISQAVADDLISWNRRHPPTNRYAKPKIMALHLGADIAAAAPTTGMPDNASKLLDRIGATPTFLMVGTIEPRKGHLQTIAAFEELWRNGTDINLVVVGAEGWRPLPPEQRRTIPEIVQKLRHHPELGKRLFWLEGISDEYLETIYAACVCLIAPSEGEGFGLPLIEAARHKIPILARDIAVFREVAGEHAFYFSGADADDLAMSIRSWLALYLQGQHPRSDDMRWLTWADNVTLLKEILLRSEVSDQDAAERNATYAEIPFGA